MRGRSSRRSAPPSWAPASSPAPSPPVSSSSARSGGARFERSPRRCSRWRRCCWQRRSSTRIASAGTTRRRGDGPLVYAAVPLAVLFIWRRQERNAEPAPPPHPALRQVRILSAGVGCVLAVSAAALFVWPADLGELWPWQLTPLLGRAVASWCTRSSPPPCCSSARGRCATRRRRRSSRTPRCSPGASCSWLHAEVIHGRPDSVCRPAAAVANGGGRGRPAAALLLRARTRGLGRRRERPAVQASCVASRSSSTEFVAGVRAGRPGPVHRRPGRPAGRGPLAQGRPGRTDWRALDAHGRQVALVRASLALVPPARA